MKASDFRVETIRLSTQDKIRLRGLFQTAGVKAKTGEERASLMARLEASRAKMLARLAASKAKDGDKEKKEDGENSTPGNQDAPGEPRSESKKDGAPSQ